MTVNAELEYVEGEGWKGTIVEETEAGDVQGVTIIGDGTNTQLLRHMFGIVVDGIA